MKPHVQKLPLADSTSFVARTYRTPNFEVGWHQHQELELILFTEGSGLSFVGNHIGEFQTGDIYLIGSNLPHTFQKHRPEMITSAIVVQFKPDFWGDTFLHLPESKAIRELMTTSESGLKLHGHTQKKLKGLISSLETETGFSRILLLCQCLDTIAKGHEYKPVSTQNPRTYSEKDKNTIERIYDFTLQNFRERITLETVADLASMSIPAFCNYFKRSTKKTYVDFLNEIRIGHACSLLTETNQTVKDICHESGFNSEVNFHKQFTKLKNTTPLQYRKRAQLALAGAPSALN